MSQHGLEDIFTVHQNERLRRLLERHSPEAREKVQRAFKQWNLILRDYLRSETGLRLTVGDEAQAVPLRIADGLPAPFQQILSEFEEYLEILLILPRLEASVSGLDEVLRRYDSIIDLRLCGDTFAFLDDITKTRGFIEGVIQNLRKIEFLKKIGEIEQDVLGAYFFNKKQIEIYWMPIALTAALLGVPVEALAIVVITHELAHAYTHLGKDIDGEQWDTEAFAKGNLSITEGLAQFYTSVVCEKLKGRFPAALEAYEKLLQIQSGAYIIHQDWIDRGVAEKEVVRVTMIKCRKLKTESYEEFSTMMDYESHSMTQL